MGEDKFKYEATVWDNQFREDVKSGRFFWVTNKSVIDFKRGHFHAFWKLYDKLPDEVKSMADKNFLAIKNKENDPSLKVFRIGRYWSMQIDEKFRALGVEVEKEGLLWCWIGNYSDYNQFVPDKNMYSRLV